MIDVLIGARDFVSWGWSQRCLARDADGRHCGATSLSAKTFCVEGAIQRAAAELSLSARVANCAILFVGDLAREDYSNGTPKGWILAHWNDEASRTQEEVVRLLDKAIDKLRESWWRGVSNVE